MSFKITRSASPIAQIIMGQVFFKGGASVLPLYGSDVELHAERHLDMCHSNF